MEVNNMDITLEMVDEVVNRTGVSYREAKEALEKNNANVVDAIIYIEGNKGKSWTTNVTDKGEMILDKIKEILKKGNVTKIVVKKDGDIFMNIPVTAGAVGVALSPILALVGLGTAMITRCTFEIVKDDGEIIDVNKIVDDKIGRASCRERV